MVRARRNERGKRKERKRLKTVFFLPIPKRCHFVLYEKTYEKTHKKKRKKNKKKEGGEDEATEGVVRVCRNYACREGVELGRRLKRSESEQIF